MQLELFPFDDLTDSQKTAILGEIRNSYWHIRNNREGRFSWANKRRHYRRIAAQKKRLLLAGVEKREILDFLKCCRLKCASRKPPFKGCKHCL